MGINGRQGVLGTSRLKAATGGKKRRNNKTIGLDHDLEEDFH
jgi:hypothetical protein